MGMESKKPQFILNFFNILFKRKRDINALLTQNNPKTSLHISNMNIYETKWFLQNNSLAHCFVSITYPSAQNQKEIDRDRTRTCNPQIRSLVPYPLGHTTQVVTVSQILHNVLMSFNCNSNCVCVCCDAVTVQHMCSPVCHFYNSW